MSFAAPVNPPIATFTNAPDGDNDTDTTGLIADTEPAVSLNAADLIIKEGDAGTFTYTIDDGHGNRATAQVRVDGAAFRDVSRIPRLAKSIAFEFNETPDGWICVHHLDDAEIRGGSLCARVTGPLDVLAGARVLPAVKGTAPGLVVTTPRGLVALLPALRRGELTAARLG